MQVACLQVGKLLRSLNINAEQLPSGGQGPPQSWDAIFRAGETWWLRRHDAVQQPAQPALHSCAPHLLLLGVVGRSEQHDGLAWQQLTALKAGALACLAASGPTLTDSLQGSGATTLCCKGHMAAPFPYAAAPELLRPSITQFVCM